MTEIKKDLKIEESIKKGEDNKEIKNIIIEKPQMDEIKKHLNNVYARLGDFKNMPSTPPNVGVLCDAYIGLEKIMDIFNKLSEKDK